MGSKDPLLVGLHGPKGCGKDLMARMLQKYIPELRQFAFATKLKALCSTAFGVPIHHFHLEELKEKPVGGMWDMTPRDMMTSMANATKFAYGLDFYSRDLYTHWNTALYAHKGIVVTDVRHREEYETVKDLGGVIVHIQRPGNTLYKPSSHISEAGLLPAVGDYSIVNDRDKAELLRKVRAFVGWWRGSDALNKFPYCPVETPEFGD